MERRSLSGFWDEVAVLNTGGLRIFNSLGFIALVVFLAVLLTSVSLSAPAGRTHTVTEPQKVRVHITAPAQRPEQHIYR